MLKSKAALWVSGIILSTLAYQNCSPVSFTHAEDTALPSTGTESGFPGDGTPLTDTQVTLKTIQPALAVRGMNCVLCHAQIKANVITDFGLGTPQFLGGINSGYTSESFYKDSNWFGNLAEAWQSSHIAGTVFVPDAVVTGKAQAVLGAAYQNKPLLKIADFMRTPYPSTYTTYTNAQESNGAMDFNIVPLVGNDSVVSKSQIVIRAPSESEIKDLAPDLWTSAESSGAARVGSSDAIQLLKKGSAGQTFLQNDEASVLQCSKSDLVIRGTLLLRRLKVNAEGGCRLYVTGTVFIEEGITYVGGGSLQNLQITSASAIIMGLNSASLQERFVNRRENLQLVARDYKSLQTQVFQEAANIGDLKDAVTNYSPRASYDFTAVLLNAPIIHSRYLGLIKGTVIAEAALFALGQFHFEFDPVFTQVNVFPLLKQPVLSVK